MTPHAIQKLRKKLGVPWPGLRDPQADLILDLARSIADSDPATRCRFWGLVDSVHAHTDGSAVIHCFNHSTTSARFPWDGEAVGLGQRFRLRIRASGTILARKTHQTTWHSLDTPFLVFQVAPGADSARALERLEPGLLLTDPGSAVQSQTLRISAPAGWVWPGIETRSRQEPRPIVLSHWLSQPVPGQLIPQYPEDVLTSHGMERGCPTAVLRLERPVVVDPGWVVAFHAPGRPRDLAYACVTEVGREIPFP